MKGVLKLLKERRMEKLNKYNWFKPNHLKCDVTEIEVIALVIGSCGTILPECINDLKKLRISTVARSLQITAMMGSTEIIDVHLNKKG